MFVAPQVRKDREAAQVLGMGSEADLAQWERLDDVIMGGQSSSSLKATGEGAAEFSGDLVIEGGGFCGARTKVWAAVVAKEPHHQMRPQAQIVCTSLKSSLVPNFFLCSPAVPHFLTPFRDPEEIWLRIMTRRFRCQNKQRALLRGSGTTILLAGHRTYFVVFVKK
jgi:hypothetical protein